MLWKVRANDFHELQSMKTRMSKVFKQTYNNNKLKIKISTAENVQIHKESLVTCSAVNVYFTLTKFITLTVYPIDILIVVFF